MPVVHDAPGAGHASPPLELLEHAVTIALSPLDYPDIMSWGDALTSALCLLAEARAGAILLPGERLEWRAVTPGAAFSDPEAVATHHELTERFHAPGDVDLVTWARDDLAGDSMPRSGAPSNGTVGIRVRTQNGIVAAVCVHRDKQLGAVPAHVLAALRAIAPALRTGVAAWLGANTCRTNVVRMLDSLADPALMFDVSGTLVHANPALERLTSAPDAARLRAEAQHVAWSLGAVARRRSQTRPVGPRAAGDRSPDHQAIRRVRVGSTIVRLRGSVVGEQLLGTEPGVLVTITTEAAEPLSDDTLQAEYGLTAREVQVARLVAAGLSNNEIAERLGVRFFTARNHVERTLAKLGVASRNRVGPVLRNESPEPTNRASAA